ncbi:MAG: polysaccharide deacetylase family protein [Myxococcales bacterium]
MFALTFDDGPGPSTSRLLDVLRDSGVRATFFLLGRNVEEAPWCGDPAVARALAERAVREGHVLGNHTYSHFRPDRWRELAADVRRGEAVVRSLRQGPVPFRLPYGIQRVEGAFPLGTIGEQMDPRLAVIASMGIGHQHWTSDFDDWTLREADAPALARRMLAHVEKCQAAGIDAVLDLHDSGTGSGFGYERPATVLGVKLFLDEALRRGWTAFQP